MVITLICGIEKEVTIQYNNMDVYAKKENTPERFKANVKITRLFKT